MKITTHFVSAPLHTPFVTALRTATHADSLLVEISDGELSGWGEAPQVWKVTGESLAGAQACVEGPITVKVGTGDAAADFERVRRIREAIGPGPRLRLDANQGWTRRDAVTAIRALEDAGCDIELVEQPVPAADLEGMAWVTDRVGTPILADESVYGVRDLVAVIRHSAADMVNVKLAKCGGLGTARTLLELAREHGVGSIVGSMMESHVGVGAAAALVSAYPTSAVNDLDAAWWLKEAPVVGGIRYEGPLIHLPTAPGLGVTGLAA